MMNDSIMSNFNSVPYPFFFLISHHYRSSFGNYLQLYFMKEMI